MSTLRNVSLRSPEQIGRVFEDLRLDLYQATEANAGDTATSTGGSVHFPLGGSSIPLPSPRPPKR